MRVPPGVGRKEKKPDVSIEKKPFAGKKTPRAYGFDDYREQFLQQKLTGARRQTYIHDSLYKVLARVLPVIAPEMSVPTFVNSVLSDHLKRYQDIINGMYNRKRPKNRWNGNYSLFVDTPCLCLLYII